MRLESAGHTPSGGLVATPSSDSLGVFLHRSAAGAGSIAAPASKLRWNYAAAGLTSTNELDIAVYGIEMVYVPEGAFELGSGGSEANHFYSVPDVLSTYTISNENELVYGDLDGNIKASGIKFSRTVPAEFPKGFQAFYCMKYECSQGQYTSFLNALDSPEAAKYYPNSYGSSRHTITTTNDSYLAEALIWPATLWMAQMCTPISTGAACAR